MIRRTVGERLRDFRKSEGMTMRDLANDMQRHTDVAKLYHSLIARYENHAIPKGPGLWFLEAFYKTYGHNTAVWLAFGTPTDERGDPVHPSKIHNGLPQIYPDQRRYI
jgi:transcriptional regulator with XRE-family HTH domain